MRARSPLFDRPVRPRGRLRQLSFGFLLGLLVPASCQVSSPPAAVDRPARPARDAAGDSAPLRPPGELAEGLAQLVFDRAARQRLTRPDGHVYAIDVGLLMLAAALAGSRDRYVDTVALLREHFLVPKPPGLRGALVAWRARLGAQRSALDASGTTEALHAAEALYAGGELFNRSADERLADRLMEGYAGHAAMDSGVWIVRNYYNLRTRTFATNSYTIDYAPDLVVYAAERMRDPQLREVARQTVLLLEKARRPNGLLDAVVQPELITLYPSVIFSPNDVIILEHACIVAEHAAVTMPALAQRLVTFITARVERLHRAYLGRSGAVSGDKTAEVGTYAAATRLAVRTGNRGLLARLRRPLLEHAGWLLDHPSALEIHAAGQALLALHLLMRAETGTPLPAVLGPGIPALADEPIRPARGTAKHAATKPAPP